MKFPAVALLVLAASSISPAPLPGADAARPEASSAAKPSLQAELEEMGETDQAQRRLMTDVGNKHGQNSPEMRALWKIQSEVDAKNIKRLEEIIAEHGWPKRSGVGPKAASAAFLILQHSDISYQKKYLPLAREAALAKEMSGGSLALLEDRILMREGKKQIYGSQLRGNGNGEYEVHPIEDEANVDQRRAAVGLPPLADYLAGFVSRGSKLAKPEAAQPIPNAPPLTQDIFLATDDRSTALQKLRAIRLPRGDDAVRFQFACRDFLARFPDGSSYSAVRLLAVNNWISIREPELSRLGDWDPTSAERDPQLSPEPRAQAAMQIAISRAARSLTPGAGDWAEVQFAAVAAALPPHRETHSARDALIRAALELKPAEAIPRLRELYPDDPSIAAAIAALERIGQPCDYSISTADGRTFDRAASLGKVVLLVFWSGQAGSTLTRLNALAETHRDAGLVVLGINLDSDPAVAAATIKENAVAWPNQIDGAGWNTALAREFYVKMAPAHFIIDRAGLLRFRGTPGTPALTRDLTTLLAEKTPE